MKRTKARKPAPLSLWAARWSGVAIIGSVRSREISTFTVAATKAEAIKTMADGLLGLPGIEGSNVGPDKSWRVPATDTGAKKGYAIHLLLNGYLFIPPQSRMTADDVSELVGRLVSR